MLYMGFLAMHGADPSIASAPHPPVWRSRKVAQGTEKVGKHTQDGLHKLGLKYGKQGPEALGAPALN
jgi:hypothetical protein